MATRTCSCGAPITRHSHSGKCRRCTQHRNQPTAGLQVTGDKAELTRLSSESVRTLAQLIRVCEIDTTQWTVERWIANKWDAGETPCYQVKAWLVAKRSVQQATRTIADMLKDAGRRMPAWRGRRHRAPSDLALELAIPDLHLGKLAWGQETDEADYDVRIAAQVYRDAVEALLARTASFKLGQIILPIGNDFFHSDNKAGATTKGTPLDTDSRYHKMFTEGRRLLTQTIERLRRVAPVTVVAVPGNHDTLSAFHVSDSLACWYRQTPDVTVINTPTPRKYVRWGQVLILYTHGDKGKKIDYPLLMATERPKDFGDTTYREIHTGHLHMTKVDERHGVRTRIIPALCPADAWHSENHFIGQQRAAEGYVWSQTEGLVSLAVYTIPRTTARAHRA